MMFDKILVEDDNGSTTSCKLARPTAQGLKLLKFTVTALPSCHSPKRFRLEESMEEVILE